MKRKRVAFILQGYPLGVSSMIIGSIKMFARKGLDVDVYVNKSSFDASPISFPEPEISIHVQDDTARFPNLVLKAYRFALRAFVNLRGLSGWLSRNLPVHRCLCIFFPELAVFSAWLRKETAGREYAFLIPVECRSLLALHHLRENSNILYYNMELLDWSEKNPLYRNKTALKNLEFRLMKIVSRVVIQSADRARLFSEINSFDMRKICILPVASTAAAVPAKSRFFRERLDIPPRPRIVLYAGNFMPWAYCLEIVRSVKEWPDNYCLVMHTWNRASLETAYYKTMRDAAKGLPVYFSADYIEYDKLAGAFSSADIGLMFYEAIDGNFTEVLFSSNKLSEYLKAGLPIICSDFQPLKAFVEENGIGLGIGNVRDLPGALRTLSARIDLLRTNALACYESKFRFENYFEAFYNRLMDRPSRLDVGR